MESSQPTEKKESFFRHEVGVISSWLHGFKTFIRRGNVVDLAVGVMIGAAFGKIVTSFVNDIVTPPLGLFMGRVKFTDLKWRLGGPENAPVTINYGVFLQQLFDFTLVAFALFALISLINHLHKKPPPPPTQMSVDQKLLTEIRDELRNLQKSQSAPAPSRQIPESPSTGALA